MAKKRKTLPKDFDDLLKKGNLDELKAVFDKCELDAYGGYSKETALAFDECPHELAKWLIEQGANLHATDTYGNTPLHSRSRSIFGNIKSLIELGADVNAKNRDDETPLHSAAHGHNVENTIILLAHGAKIDVVSTGGGYEPHTPFEVVLSSCNNTDIIKTVELSKIYLGAGAQITNKLKKYVKEIGKEFEFHRANFNKKSVNEYSNALEELYNIFGVEPITKRVMHDGKSPIIAKEKTWQKQHQELWEQLVPSSGACETMQGEVIRITGRISNELDGNGGINWDADFKKMADAFLVFVKQGTPLSSTELAEAEEIIKEIKQKSGETTRMAELGVIWVIGNPSPLKLPTLEYKR